MKLFMLSLLAFMLVGFVWAQKCKKKCGPCILPTCNFDGKCYFEGSSACALDNEKCRRKMKKLPPFIKTESGFCEEGVRKCKI
ncbi:U-Kazal-Dg21.2 isoform X2 [Drosophila biarmipes]|uniref:U-Kazal-Dg21.2 isoform X2 n=1 Tax=Drosophila biarmipes TaxID=125945 RepID=UPI0007E7538A|nr:U-Kazal-Dg21.2 isoform X2 [Drosophila biarmipes]